jgi:DNA excision repair protein ERCC-2
MTRTKSAVNLQPSAEVTHVQPATGVDSPIEAIPPMKYTVSVRALCEFTAKQGNLDLRFTPAPSAEEGVIGHRVVQARRPAPYQAEVSLSGEYKRLLVRGRADGFDPARNQLEEIKTFRGDLGMMPDNHRRLHWAQVKIYGWLLCQKLGLERVCLALVYFDIASKKEVVLSETQDASALKEYFDKQCECFLNWAEQELTHRTGRDAALIRLSFPHESFRHGQRQLAEAVYKTVMRGHCLIAQAPTGIGKTIGTLFPFLKAWPGQALDKIFFLTAKTSGRKLALEALMLIKHAHPGLPLRVIELVAREKACEHPDKACHGASCPLANGFYDRLPQARNAALALASADVLDKEALRAVARKNHVCPYYLSQDLIQWSDVVIGDYNHYFDLGAILHGLNTSNQWAIGVLVDEAHNLIGRAQTMYTAELAQTRFHAARRVAPAQLGKVLDRLNRRWNAICKDQVDAYAVYATVPEKFLMALQQAITAITDYSAENPEGFGAAGVSGELQRFYFDSLHFVRICELFDEHSLFDVTLDLKDEKVDRVKNGTSRKIRHTAALCLRNIIPAPLIAHRFAAARSIVLFSATLSPQRFYIDMLGLPENTGWVDVSSPFRPEQLLVQVVSHISTRYRHREASISPIVDLISRQYLQSPGNYLAFFSSFEYLRRVTLQFRSSHPRIPIWEQTPGMDETEQLDFLRRFTTTSQGIGFAVLGGSFAEGIDLPGKRLSGAFIATLGLPQVNRVNEQVKLRMDSLFNAGYDYTYFFPGIRKVVQAAGRVIRTPLDEGVVYLIDDRFARPGVRRLLPGWWKIEQFPYPEKQKRQD